MGKLSKSVFNYLKYNAKVNTTRCHYNPRLNFDLFKWNTRITLDGSKILQHYENNTDIDNDKIDLLPFIKQIDMRSPNSDYEVKIKNLIDRYKGMNVLCEQVRSFDRVY